MQQIQPAHKTAVLLFSRSLEEEYRAKSFGLSYRRFKRLYHHLLRSTRSAIRTSGLPMIESFSWDQHGTTFGQRLSSSIRKVLNQGFDKVIVVGNDAPYLTADLLREAEQLLNLGKPVLGPDGRGGTYLMAFGRDCFKKTDFHSIEWQTDQVFDQLLPHLKPSILEANLQDINEKVDLFRLAANTSMTDEELQRLLIELFDFAKNYQLSGVQPVSKGFIPHQISRGPPLFILPS